MERVIASGDVHVLGPNTNLNAFEVFRDDLPGKAIALITQSGHQGRPIFQGQEIGIKLSHWAPAGNEADLESADFINYFSSLESTGAIACYIEGFKNGRTLQLAADAAARRKVPIVAVKVGRTDEGTSMAKAHTGHLTGSDDVVSAAFRQYGVQRVDGLDQLLEVSAALARTKAPSPEATRRLTRGAGGRVCVYSISGGTGAHMADMVSAAGLELPSLTKDSQTQLHEWIPPYLRVSNPVDNGGAPVRDWRGPKIIQTMLADPNVDLLLCPITGARAVHGQQALPGPGGRGGDDGQAPLRGVGLPRRHRRGLHQDAAPEHRADVPHVHQRGHGGEGLLRPPPLRRLLPVSAFAHPALRPSPARKKALPLLGRPPGAGRRPRPEPLRAGLQGAARGLRHRGAEGAHCDVPRRGGQGSEEDRLPGRDEDRLRRHPAQVRPRAWSPSASATRTTPGAPTSAWWPPPRRPLPRPPSTACSWPRWCRALRPWSASPTTTSSGRSSCSASAACWSRCSTT